MSSTRKSNHSAPYSKKLHLNKKNDSDSVSLPDSQLAKWKVFPAPLEFTEVFIADGISLTYTVSSPVHKVEEQEPVIIEFPLSEYARIWDKIVSEREHEE